MKIYAMSFAIVIGEFLGATPLVALSSRTAQGEPKRPDVVITQAESEKKMLVKKGDLIEVRLPAGLTSYWAQEGSNPILRRLTGPKAEPAPRVGGLPTLDGRYLSVNRFEVVEDSAVPLPLKMMYCAPPTERERLERVKPEDPTDLAFWTRQRLKRKEFTPTQFHPGLDVSRLKEGMVFHMSFRTKDDPSKVQKSLPGR
jgi:hypothetical protein